MITVTKPNLPPLEKYVAYLEKLWEGRWLTNDGEIRQKIGRVTCTTAHEAYSSPAMERQLGYPLHKLSVYVSPEQYDKKCYSEKENLMIVSPDEHPMKDKIMRLISSQFPNLSLRIIRNLTYEEYKKTISQAKWALTFGEGLDGYFVETVFSGGISFAVYNDNFFTGEFKNLRTVYPSFDTLIAKICKDIRNLDNESAYAEYQKEQYNLCSRYYNYNQYIDNLSSFYLRYFHKDGGEVL